MAVALCRELVRFYLLQYFTKLMPWTTVEIVNREANNKKKSGRPSCYGPRRNMWYLRTFLALFDWLSVCTHPGRRCGESRSISTCSFPQSDVIRHNVLSVNFPRYDRPAGHNGKVLVLSRKKGKGWSIWSTRAVVKLSDCNSRGSCLVSLFVISWKWLYLIHS